MKTPFITPGSDIRTNAHHQAGIGLVHVMLILLLVGSALAAGALLMQSKRAPRAALEQEQTLRWVDEAIAAFASANARLPCPADRLDGPENCASGKAKGWIPTQTLIEGSGTGPRVGPVAYMLYRGNAGDALDLAAPINAYQPTVLSGDIRKIEDTDSAGKDIEREFGAINSLDICVALSRASAATPDQKLANVGFPNGQSRNIAYGIQAAGPDSGPAIVNAFVAGSALTMDAPSRAADADYDARVRVRTFDGLGQALGCRVLETDAVATGNPSSNAGLQSPYDVSVASMDVLAASVTLHDTLGALRENNVDATNSATLSAISAQATALIAVFRSVGTISDSISSLTLATADLSRSVATCIASLGVMCWEVPLKATAVALGVASLITNTASLGIKAAAMVPTAIALEKNIAARDRAQKAARPPSEDPKAAADEMACTLYGSDPPDLDYNPCTSETDFKYQLNPDYSKDPVYLLDGNGNKIPVVDADGKPVKDENGNIVYKTDPSKTQDPSQQYIPVYKLDAKGEKIPRRDNAGNPLYDSNGKPLYEVEREPSKPAQGLDEKRDLAKADWQDLQKNVDILQSQRLVHWTDTNIRYRIEESRSTSLYGGRYIEYRCDYVGANQGDFERSGSSCVSIAPVEGIKQGSYNRVQVFKWSLAIADAVARRSQAELWTKADLRYNEIDQEVEQLQKNYDQWFKGNSSIVKSMEKERDDKNHCGASNPTELTRQKCVNAQAAIRYIHTCYKQEADLTTGTTREVYETQPEANCKPLMQKRIDDTAAQKDAQRLGREAAKKAYDDLPSPYIAYPVNNGWFTHAIETIYDSDKNPIDYVWKQSTTSIQYEIGKWQLAPYYAPEPYGSSGTSQILVTSKLELRSKDVCEFFQFFSSTSIALTQGLYCQRYPYNRAYADWLRASTAASKAKQSYDDLNTQFDQLFIQYRKLRCPELDENDAEFKALGCVKTDASNANTRPIGFGAESALERADNRGSVGPMPMRGL